MTAGVAVAATATQLTQKGSPCHVGGRELASPSSSRILQVIYHTGRRQDLQLLNRVHSGVTLKRLLLLWPVSWLSCSSSASSASIAPLSSISASAAAALVLARGQIEVLQELVPLLPVWGNSAVISNMPLLCADGKKVQGSISEVDLVWPVCRFVVPDGTWRAGVASSSSSEASTSSSSAPSTVAKGVDPVACAVAGRRRGGSTWGVIH